MTPQLTRILKNLEVRLAAAENELNNVKAKITELEKRQEKKKEVKNERITESD